MATNTAQPNNATRNASELPRLAYSVKELAIAAGVSERHIQNLVARGELRVKRAGRRVLIPVTAARQWIDG